MPAPILTSSVFPAELYTATIVLYVLLIIPTISIWRKHGRPGFLGYNYVYGFCAIRIAGGALSLAATNQPSLETSATIVNSMAISPLILAALGLLHEARSARIADINKPREWFLVILHHTIVTVAMVLIIVGIVNVIKGSSTVQNSSLIKLGLALLVISYVVLVFWATISLRGTGIPKKATFFDGTSILYAVFGSLFFIGMRLVYGIMSFLLADPAFASSLVAKVILSTVPELLATFLFVLAGYNTRDMYRVQKPTEYSVL